MRVNRVFLREELVVDECIFLAVASVDIDLGTAIGSSRRQIKSDSANAATCATLFVLNAMRTLYRVSINSRVPMP